MKPKRTRTPVKSPVETYYDYVIGSERWARLRERLLRTRGRQCERCDVPQTERDLELHHLTYERLGAECDDDVQILCQTCHVLADRERQRATEFRHAEQLFACRVDGWMMKRYGEDWNDTIPYDEAEDRFSRWLDERGEE